MVRLLSWDGESLAMRGMEMVKGDCCGDSVLGWMLREAGVGVSGLFPMFSPWAGEGTPYTQRAWCQPVVSLHKTGVGGVEGLWRWEGERGRGVSLINSCRDGFWVRFADDDGGSGRCCSRTFSSFIRLRGRRRGRIGIMRFGTGWRRGGMSRGIVSRRVLRRVRRMRRVCNICGGGRRRGSAC